MVDGGEEDNLLGKEFGTKARKCVATLEMVISEKNLKLS